MSLCWEIHRYRKVTIAENAKNEWITGFLVTYILGHGNNTRSRGLLVDKCKCLKTWIWSEIWGDDWPPCSTLHVGDGSESVWKIDAFLSHLSVFLNSKSSRNFFKNVWKNLWRRKRMSKTNKICFSYLRRQISKYFMIYNFWKMKKYFKPTEIFKDEVYVVRQFS